MSWIGSGVDSQFYSMNLICSACGGDYLAEFYADDSCAWIEWWCEEIIEQPRWAFWRSKVCGFGNNQEVEL